MSNRPPTNDKRASHWGDNHLHELQCDSCGKWFTMEFVLLGSIIGFMCARCHPCGKASVRTKINGPLGGPGETHLD